KEVKTQISYADNLMGNVEEEHAGGALAFPAYDLGDEFFMNSRVQKYNHTFAEQSERFREIMDVRPEGYAIDKNHPNIVYVPKDVRFNLRNLTASWINENGEQTIRLHPAKTYVRPSGYQIRMRKYPGQKEWRLIGTVAEGVFCHKPSTVSGGGNG